jgi:hypothetical protein
MPWASPGGLSKCGTERRHGGKQGAMTEHIPDPRDHGHLHLRATRFTASAFDHVGDSLRGDGNDPDDDEGATGVPVAV